MNGSVEAIDAIEGHFYREVAAVGPVVCGALAAVSTGVGSKGDRIPPPEALRRLGLAVLGGGITDDTRLAPALVVSALTALLLLAPGL